LVVTALEQSQPYATARAESGFVESRGRIYRQVNDRIRELSGLYDFGEPLRMFCECGAQACRATIAIEPSRYEEVRELGTRFFVAAGHTEPDDIVVERTANHWVVDAIPTRGSRCDDG
jgi:hypothetical protein